MEIILRRFIPSLFGDSPCCWLVAHLDNSSTANTSKHFLSFIVISRKLFGYSCQVGGTKSVAL